MDTTRYRALFIEESVEHLQAMATLTLKLESEPQNSDIINEIFRHAHSVKGMALSMGYGPIANLSHKLEDLVTLCREDAPEQSWIDLILRAVDGLQEQVECISSESPLNQHLEILASLSRAIASKSSGTPGRAPAPAASSEAPTAARKWVVVTLDRLTTTPSVRAFMVHRKLSGMTSVFQSIPRVEDIRAGRLRGFELRFEVQGELDEVACKRAVKSVSDVEDIRFEAVGEVLEESAPVSEQEGLEPSSLKERPIQSAEFSTVRVKTTVLDQLVDTVGELFFEREKLRLLLEGSSPEVRAALDSLGSRVRDIHEQVMAVRTLPIRVITARYPRMARDLARSLNKEVCLEVQGDDIGVDRAALDGLDACLLHAIRNSLDHGIESATERVARGKEAIGKLSIVARRDRDSIVIEVGDDGRGLNARALREAAVGCGLIGAEQAEKLSQQESLMLVFAPGLSTRSEVSDLSGRGVGMDAIRTRIESIGGSVDLRSEQGSGTCLTLEIPSALAILPVLLVEVAQRQFALPLSKVVAVREPSEPFVSKGQIGYGGRVLRVNTLADLLELEGDSWSQAVVLEDQRQHYALGVDRVFGYREIVVKPLGNPLDRLQVFSGVGVMGDGSLALILEVPGVVGRRWAA